MFSKRPAGPVRVGISQCLMGDAVRYDGSGASSSCPHDELDGLFEYQTFCPEVGIGMSVPREPIRLVGPLKDYRAVAVDDPCVDKTDELIQFAHDQLAKIDLLCGYIFMHHSPSCGLQAVKLYATHSAQATREGTGVYANEIVRARPTLPVTDANQLFDEKMRENFVMRVFTYAHWQSLMGDLNATNLRSFHRQYASTLSARDPQSCETADRLLIDLSADLISIANVYLGILMAGLEKPALSR